MNTHTHTQYSKLKAKIQNLKKQNNLQVILFSILLSFLGVSIITYAATTIGTNINTGGTLTVSGASNLQGAVWASSTLQATGNITGYGTLTINSTTATSAIATGGFTVGSSQFVVQQGSGNVGIGTTSPDSLLQLSKLYNGNTTFLHINNQSDWGQTGDIVFSYNTSLITLGKITTGYKATNSGRIEFYPATSGVFNSAALMSVEGGSTYGIGIGVSAPGGLLEITASSTYGTTRDLFLLSSDSTKDGDRLIVKNSGNLGIGTTSPSSLLSVHGNALISGNLTSVANITATGTLLILSTTATSTFSTGGLTVGTSQFVVQQTGGNVGIGTTTPTTKFQVTNSSTSATTTIEIGKANQNKGSCLKLYNSVGALYYCRIDGGAFTCNTTSCE